MDVVLTGLINKDVILEIIKNFLNTSFIERVIISTWEGQEIPIIEDSRVNFILNIPPENPGNNNRNLQIKASQVGVNNVTSDICIKSRTDQVISVNSLEMINRFFNKFKEPELKYLDGTGPKYKMFCCGDFHVYPFHPRDQFFMSDTESMKRLYDIPFCSMPPQPAMNCDHMQRVETYIGANYVAHFDKEVREMISNGKEFLQDDSPSNLYAVKLSRFLFDKVFQILPRIEVFNGKYKVPYNYEHHSVIERWYDKPWE